MSRPTKRQAIAAIALAVAAVRVAKGGSYRGPCATFLSGYLTGVLVPMTMDPLLGLFAWRPLRPRTVRASALLAFGSFVEAA